MGTRFTLCLVCFEKSRIRKGWWCPHCEHMKPPEPRLIDVTPIPRPQRKPVPLPVAKPITKTAAKAERRSERDRLAEDIAKIDRSKLPQLNLRPKAGLRRS